MAVSIEKDADRIDRVRDRLDQENLDLLLVAPSSDMRYLLGVEAHASERPTILAINRFATSLILVPAFEAGRLENLPGIKVVSWDETDDAFVRLRESIAGPVDRIAVSDQMWASVLLGLKRALPGSDFVQASSLLRPLRMVKTREEIELLHRAGAAVDATFSEIVAAQFSGRTEREIGNDLNERVRRHGLHAGDWGPIVGSGPNSTSPHHNTGERIVQAGDAVVLDFGGTLAGYQADITRTIHVGAPSDEFLRIYQTVYRAQQAAVEAVRPGVSAEQVDAAARDIISAAGYGEYFTHRTGHGIGLDAHEEPYIVAGNSIALQEGMTFSVEPGIYLPGKFGVRIEDIVVVTADGSARLNSASRELKSVK